MLHGTLEQVSCGHALVKLLQRELRGVGRRSRQERDDCVLCALVIRVWQGLLRRAPLV